MSIFFLAEPSFEAFYFKTYSLERYASLRQLKKIKNEIGPIAGIIISLK
jgi:hypothetical protein